MEISYHDALRLKLNATTSVASASITFFRHWCDRQALDLPPAVKLLQQHGVDIQSMSTYTVSKDSQEGRL